MARKTPSSAPRFEFTRGVTLVLIALVVLAGCRGKDAPKSLDGDGRKGITTAMTGWKYISHGGGSNCVWWIETKVRGDNGKEIIVVVNRGQSRGKNKPTSVRFYSANADGGVFVARHCADFYREDQDVEQ